MIRKLRRTIGHLINMLIFAPLALALVILVLLWLMQRQQQQHKSTSAPSDSAPKPETSERIVLQPSEPAEEDVEPGEAEKAAEPDDLRRIEGIGPKVANLLNAAGITTFAHLAETEARRLREILSEANLRFINPETWPEQAELAAAERWEALAQLQDELKGGRRA